MDRHKGRSLQNGGRSDRIVPVMWRAVCVMAAFFLALGLRAMVAQQPAVNQALRYPLPQVQSPVAPVQQPPTTAASSQAVSYSPSAAAPQPALFRSGQTVAIVGDKFILYGDVAPTVNMVMAPLLEKAKSEAERQQIEAYREMWTKGAIQQAVNNKTLLLEFERGMPSDYKTDPKKRADARGKIDKQVQTFFEQALTTCREKIANASPEDIEKMLRQDPTVMRLAVLMKERHLESPAELDAALREFGTSLDRQVKEFGEYQMGMQAIQSKLRKKHEVTHQELLDYYQEHAADYYIPAKARFEILTAKFARFGGDRQATHNHAAMMGNEVFLGGVPFAAVAKKHSQEPNAEGGGQYDWVTPGSLASKPIDRAVFTLEVDRLSQIIEDESGFHILRVLERKEPGQISFQEAQPDIRDTIAMQKQMADRQKILIQLRTRTKIWTIYDQSTPDDASANP
jgi:hypothetical protein